jgi:hypothetical protein
MTHRAGIAQGTQKQREIMPPVITQYRHGLKWIICANLSENKTNSPDNPPIRR